MIENCGPNAGLVSYNSINEFIELCSEGLSPSLRDCCFREQYAHKLLEFANLSYEIIEDEISGIAAYYMNCDKEGFVFLTMLAVNPGYRRQALGSLLLGHMLGVAKSNKCQEARLAVQKNNPSAIMLYEKAGFVITGNGGDQFTMTLKL